MPEGREVADDRLKFSTEPLGVSPSALGRASRGKERVLQVVG